VARQLSRRRPVNTEPVEDDDEDYPATARGDADEQAERPRSRRRSRDEDDERPARTSRTRRTRDDEPDDEERPARSRRSRDEDDEDDRSSRKRQAPERKRRAPAASRSSVTSGWGDHKSRTRDFDKERFSVEEKNVKHIVVFLDPEPIASWMEHFIRELPKGTRKSYTCYDPPGAEDIDCPLCQVGDDPALRRAFNVIVFDKKGNPEVKYWVASPAILNEIERFAKNADWLDSHGGEICGEGNYFVVSKSDSSRRGFDYRLDAVKARDLDEDYEIEPLTAAEIEELREDAFDRKAVVKEDSLDDLDDVAEKIS
jgi:hypothetical protein